MENIVGKSTLGMSYRDAFIEEVYSGGQCKMDDVYGTSESGNLLHTNYSIMCKKILSHNLKDPFRNFVDFMMPRTSGGDYVHKSYIVFTLPKVIGKDVAWCEMSVKNSSES
jgi:hypothetical protein